MNTRTVLTIAASIAVGVTVWYVKRGDTAAAVQEPPVAAAPMPEVPAAPAPVASANPQAGTAAVSSTPSAAPPMPGAQALPIDVSPGFEMLSTPASEMKSTDRHWASWRRHQELQAEPRDEGWSPRIETSMRQEIQNSLMTHGVDADRVEVRVLECRTTGCEMQAVGLMEDDQREGVDVQSIVGNLLKGNLGTEFDSSGPVVTRLRQPDHRTGYLLFLPRKKQ